MPCISFKLIMNLEWRVQHKIDLKYCNVATINTYTVCTESYSREYGVAGHEGKVAET